MALFLHKQTTKKKKKIINFTINKTIMDLYYKKYPQIRLAKPAHRRWSDDGGGSRRRSDYNAAVSLYWKKKRTKKKTGYHFIIIISGFRFPVTFF